MWQWSSELAARCRVTRWRWAAPVAGLALVLLGGSAVAAPGDIVFEREGGGGAMAPAVFPHWAHRIRYRCYVCHDAIFAMQRGATPITMKEMREGRNCGVCHDGKTAFDTDYQSCGRCHARPEG